MAGAACLRKYGVRLSKYHHRRSGAVSLRCYLLSDKNRRGDLVCSSAFRLSLLSALGAQAALRLNYKLNLGAFTPEPYGRERSPE